MAGLARIRGCVTAVSNLDGSIADVSFGDGVSERGPQGPRDKAPGDHADDEGNRGLTGLVVAARQGRGVRLRRILRSQVNDAATHRDVDGGSPIVDTQLRQDALHVDLNGLFADMQF
jgi:hypothetical protein